MTTVAAGETDRALGSVAMEVATNTSCPILCLRPEVGAEPTLLAHPLRRLLVPVDGSRATAAALQPAIPLARAMGASLDMLYIATAGQGPPRSGAAIPTTRYVDQPQHEWQPWAQEMRQRLLVECAGCSPSADIGVFLRQGDPGREIVRFARDGSYDAIVLVRRSRLEPGRAVILRTVIRDATCPLLVVGGNA
jgi:nucleotide-binding universal stress UspA family protein